MRRPLPKGLLLLAVAAFALATLTSAQGGVFSGSNGLIAYTCGTGANICTINADGTAGHTSLITGASDPSWSSDEDSIAYTSGSTGITVADFDGANPQQLFAPAGSTQPSFSFDADRVAYVRGGDIFTIQSNGGGGEQPVTNTAATEADPAYSPDGTKIAFALDSGSGYDIWTINLSNFALHQVTNAPGNERNPTWSPTSLTLVYSAGVTPGLWASPSTGSSVPTPTNLNAAGTEPAYSPDGTRIAFINPSGNLAVMPAVTSSSPTITVLDNSAGNSQPDWQSVFAPPSSGTVPVNVSYPTVNLSFGDTQPTLGDFVTASIGTWNGAFPITYAYQWKRCDPADPVNGQCFDIANARSSFYTPVAADYGKRLRVQVTATNSQGSARQNSEVTDVVTADAVVLRVTPQVSDSTPVVDAPLNLSSGSWDGSIPLTFTYSWRRCNPVGDLATCVQIPGATLATYTPAVADIGFSIRVWITGTNLAGSALAVTNHTFPVVDKQHFAPSAAETPTINGTMLVGRQLTALTGSFDGDSPIATTFTWQRCDATGAACHAILGAKKVVYHPTAADLGSTLRLAVTAKNAFGTIVSMSDPTEPVLASPPHKRGRHIVGTGKGEYIAGGGFDDVILGMGGNDTLMGGAGDDRLDGGAGKDVITGGSGADTIFGGDGSDTIYAADGERDVIDCGDGRDRAIVDSVDIVKNCEVVEKSSGSTPTPNPTPTPTPITPGPGPGAGTP